MWITPTRNRPSMRTGIEGEKAIRREAKVQNRSAVIMVGRLPNLSAKGPPRRDPAAAPRVVNETMILKLKNG